MGGSQGAGAGGQQPGGAIGGGGQANPLQAFRVNMAGTPGMMPPGSGQGGQPPGGVGAAPPPAGMGGGGGPQQMPGMGRQFDTSQFGNQQQIPPGQIDWKGQGLAGPMAPGDPAAAMAMPAGGRPPQQMPGQGGQMGGPGMQNAMQQMQGGRQQGFPGMNMPPQGMQGQQGGGMNIQSILSRMFGGMQ